MTLYKYLPAKYLKSTVEQGKILFRNLAYFKKDESAQRGDPWEGLHRDNPDHDCELTVLKSGKTIAGDFSLLREIDCENVFVFCLSQEFSKKLYYKFDSDVCIEMADINEFVKRIRKQVIPKLSTNKKAGVLHKPVHYYASNKPAEFNVSDPFEIPFAKDEFFTDQDEYRIVFGKGKKAFDITNRIIDNGKYDFREEAQKKISKELFVTIGNFEDICVVHRL